MRLFSSANLVYSLAHEDSVYFLGRPHRFGKSLLISTLKSYYLGKKELFKGLAIEELEKDWKTYPVFHLDFGIGTYTNANALDQVLDTYLSEWEEEYKVVRKPNITDFSLRFKKIIEEAHRQSGLRAVVLIDEYDKPLLDVMDLKNTINHEGCEITYEEYNRNLLRAFSLLLRLRTSICSLCCLRVSPSSPKSVCLVTLINQATSVCLLSMRLYVVLR